MDLKRKNVAKTRNIPVPKKLNNRFYEIDILRGIAVILMVIYHFFYSLKYFNILQMPSFFWPQELYRVITILFLSIAGISLSFYASKIKDTKIITKKLIIRGIKLFSIGLLITIVTWIYPHHGFIVFGALHLIGFSTILSIPFLVNAVKQQNKVFLTLPLIFGIFVFLLTSFFKKIQGPLYLAPFGIHPSQFYSLDYEPLFPWFAVILITITLGFFPYPNGKRKFSLPLKIHDTPDILKPISFLGRHSLIIYLIHQPIILGILWIGGIIDLGIF